MGAAGLPPVLMGVVLLPEPVDTFQSMPGHGSALSWGRDNLVGDTVLG